MLVLSRKANEAILLGDDIKVTILSIDGERVRIGVDAPKSLRIFRHELLTETRNLNKEAAGVALLSFGLRGFVNDKTKKD